MFIPDFLSCFSTDFLYWFAFVLSFGIEAYFLFDCIPHSITPRITPLNLRFP